MKQYIPEQPMVEVGIVWGPEVSFSLHGAYRLTTEGPADGQEGACPRQLSDDDQLVGGRHTVRQVDGLLQWGGEVYRSLLFTPCDAEACRFDLHAVTIGIGFHWQRREDQRFAGSLRLVTDRQGQVLAINLIAVEDYLVSVISSEMSAHASIELLRAHAVISRSWLLAQIGWGQSEEESALEGTCAPCVRPVEIGPMDVDSSLEPATATLETRPADAGGHSAPASTNADAPSIRPANQEVSPQVEDFGEEVVRWYDHQAHTLFHVCADDHCQRYQGLTRPITLQACEAVSSTRGQVLAYDGKVCDARFSKCCGGMLEEFPTCWADVDVPYLRRRRDLLPQPVLPDLTREPEAERWIRSTPPAFCHTADPTILRQVLNDYDQQTRDFYRWTVTYTRQELSDLVRHRLGVDLGDIVDLIPLARGTSGRIFRLKLVGTRRSLVLGKELEIRRALSASHLYSSAFVVEKLYSQQPDDDCSQAVCPQVGRSQLTVHPQPASLQLPTSSQNTCSRPADHPHDAPSLPTAFRLLGAGWGHGVGLCQIGAAVMGAQGYDYHDILLHYYPGATIACAYR